MFLSYGTVLYYLSFFYNGRQRGIPIAEVIGWVGGSNGIWIIFPLIGIEKFMLEHCLKSSLLINLFINLCLVLTKIMQS